MPSKLPPQSEAIVNEKDAQNLTSSLDENLDVKAIIKRMRAGASTKNDSDLARYLGISSKNIASWRKRNSIPFEFILKFAKLSSQSLDWIVLGDDSHKVTPGSVFCGLDTDAIALALLRLKKEDDAYCWGDHRGNVKFHTRIFYSLYKQNAHLLKVAERDGIISRGDLVNIIKEAIELGDQERVDELFPDVDKRYSE